MAIKYDVYLQFVRLHFNKFSLEQSQSCYDSLSIYDGRSATASLITKLCGSYLPGDITTSGNYVFIYFTSDVSNTNTGFTIQYSAVGGKFNIS